MCACFFTFFCNFDEKVEKVEISENVPKMSEKSSRVPEWYTSGSWTNAFDNTEWQKSPEYALIRIAAGAPDLAKSGQIRPRTAPDGKSSRIWRQGSLLLPRLKSFPELFFLIRAQISDPSTCSRGASSSATEFTHSANVRTRRKTLADTPVRVHDISDTRGAKKRPPQNTTVHTLCTTENRPCALCAQPKHRRAHLCTPDSKSRNTRARHKGQKTQSRATEGQDQNEEITQGSGMRNFVGLDEMPPTLRGRFSTDGKRTQKGAKKASPFLYIYSLQRAFFGRF